MFYISVKKITIVASTAVLVSGANFYLGSIGLLFFTLYNGHGGGFYYISPVAIIRLNEYLLSIRVSSTLAINGLNL